MKKVIFAALILLGTGALSAFTLKTDTVVAKHDTVADRKDLGTADDRKDLGTADAKTSPKHTTNDRKDLGTAD
ncbi:MAG: hypothetical protein ACXVB0_15085 [Mucilaginibacter sp.]